MPKTLVNSGETSTYTINVKKEWSVRKDRFLEDLKLSFLNPDGL
jgi:hypothetical protein